MKNLLIATVTPLSTLLAAVLATNHNYTIINNQTATLPADNRILIYLGLNSLQRLPDTSNRTGILLTDPVSIRHLSGSIYYLDYNPQTATEHPATKTQTVKQLQQLLTATEDVGFVVQHQPLLPSFIDEFNSGTPVIERFIQASYKLNPKATRELVRYQFFELATSKQPLSELAAFLDRHLRLNSADRDAILEPWRNPALRAALRRLAHAKNPNFTQAAQKYNLIEQELKYLHSKLATVA